MTADPTPWSAYLGAYHGQRPGITEAAFERACDPLLGSPHDWLTAALADRPGSVLDVACGNAPLRPRLSGAKTYLGVDLSEAEVRAAQALGRGPVVTGDARALPVSDASVDVVVSAMGLMLVQPLATAIEEVARVLRPNGTAAFLLPARAPLRLTDLRPLALLSLHLRGPGSMPQHVGRRRITALLEQAGLVVTQATTHRFPFHLRTPSDARLAVQSLYTPGRSPEQLMAAEAALAGIAGPGRELPLPLLRVVARKPG
ncbi:Methyltransferase domain-containing protein [Promicromonospora umidemergens]|uniref:Class I SAM-dependent methyltransferase n=1 Tax=Promicromonospora umidemergens TaxID=629679 RepID=A0ABP8WZK7_9MICO|nr:class I SAM-dependent methyltransferase [Promicromonospora umidemergens]MCP2285552.1 Methyltransferase domain-containing protein [Promicromonospora umidemergens]